MKTTYLDFQSPSSRLTRPSDLAKKAAVICLFLIASAFTLEAAFLRNIPQTLVQPDGTTLRCFATGDEFNHWLHDGNNYTIVQDPSTGYYVYAVKSGNTLVPSSVIAGKGDPRTAGIQPGLNRDAAEVRTRSANMFRIPALKGGNSALTTGTLNNIVIFIRFSDQPEYTDPVSKYSTAFNATGTVSMVEYFKEVSGSQLIVNTSLYPATGGTTVVSYQDGNSRSYFSKYNASTNTLGYKDDTERTDREMKLLRDATVAVKSEIEASGLDYDADNNGQIDNVCYIIQGSTDGWADLLWPHMWALYLHDVQINGSRVWNYNFQLSQTFGVGVLCHEMSHSLGFPDLYRYTDRSINPVGAWDVMASTTYPPQHPVVYQKLKYGNWTSSIPEISANGTFTLASVSASPFAAYKIKSPNSASEYFVVEYRRATGMFECQILGSGLIVYRVNPSLTGNAFGAPDEVYVFRPNGTGTVDGNITQANYSSSNGRPAIGTSTEHNLFLSDGSTPGFQISNIGTTGETISFTVTYGNATPASLNVTPVSREIASTGGTASFSVSNTGGGTMNWSAAVTAGNTWARITSGASGSNSGTINLTADPNNGASTRSAVITVTASDANGSPKTITITQAAAGAVLAVTPESRSFDTSGGTASFTVSNTGGGTMNWTATVTAGSSWLHITSGTSGTNAGTIQISADPNTGAARSATITLTANAASGSPKTLTVSQAEMGAVLTVTPETRSVEAAGGYVEFSVGNTGGGTMTWTASVNNNTNWLRISSGTSGTNAGTISVYVEPNTGSTERSATLTVNAPNAGGAPKTLTVSQGANPPVLQVTPGSRTIEFAGGVAEFTVTNTGGGTMAWSAAVTEGSSWAHLTSGSTGTNAGTIVLSVDQNPDSSPRTAEITVTANDASGSPKRITVTQTAQEAILSVGPATITLPFGGGNASFEVSCTGARNLLWSSSVTTGSNWAHVTSGATGMGSGFISLSVDANPDNSIRQAVITVTNHSAGNSTKTVSIIQEANQPVLVVDLNEVEVSYTGGTATIRVNNAGGGSMRWSASLPAGTNWARIAEGQSGVNGGLIVVQVEQNQGSPRTLSLNVTAEAPAANQKSVPIHQKAIEATVTVDPDTQTVGSEGDTVRFNIFKEGADPVRWIVEISEGDEWLNILTPGSGADNGQISVSADPNESKPRTGTLTVRFPDSPLNPKVITIHQFISNGIPSVRNDQALKTFPNPFRDELFVEIENFDGSARKLEVVNMMGQVIETRTLTEERTLIEGSDLEAGLYFIRTISQNNEISVQRVVKH